MSLSPQWQHNQPGITLSFFKDEYYVSYVYDNEKSELSTKDGNGAWWQLKHKNIVKHEPRGQK